MGDEARKSIFSRKLVLGTTVGGAIVFMFVGVIFWGGFNTAMEATNSLDFCISCHEMRDTVYQEYKQSIHYANRSGVRASCSDCHVPDPWVYKVLRKIKASNELYHKLVGSVDTPEKFEAKRLELATRVWRAMKATDSRECRNCHNFNSMNADAQKPRAQKQHENALQRGQTCIDCHKGIAHKKVQHLLADKDLEILERPDPSKAVPDGKLLRLGGGTTDAPAVAAQAPAAVAIATTPAPVPAAAASAGSEAAPTPVATAGADGGVDWSKVPSREVVLFYPGQASMEWVLNGRDHSGARPFKAGDRCLDCHEQEAADIGRKIVTGEKLEPNPIGGKRGSIPMTVQATHDGEHLYMRFQWPNAEPLPTPVPEGGEMDAENAVKLAVMLATDEVEYADRAGCWGTCHHDLRSMPDAPSGDLNGVPAARILQVATGITKYIQESRTELEIRGGDKPRGGWDKLKDEAQLKDQLNTGHIMDLMRFKSGTGESEDGYILEQRHMDGGQGAAFTGTLQDGTWTVVLKRKLQSDQPGDVSLAVDQVYNIGFAIHDDHSTARYHHVSLGYKLGFDNPDAEINAVKN